MNWPWSGSGGSQPAATLVLPDVTHSLVGFGGLDLSDYLIGCSFGDVRNQMFAGEFRLLHFEEDGTVTVPSPWGPEGSQVRAHDMTWSRALQFQTLCLGQPSQYPDLLPGDPTFDTDGILHVPFTDGTPLLMVEGTSRRDIIAETGQTVSAHDEIKAIGATRGITVDARFPDFPIRELRMSDGCPLNWMDQIAAVYRAVRRWQGRKLIYEITTLGRNSFPLEDRFRLETGTWSSDTAGLHNKWIANRLQPTPGQVGYGKQDGLSSIGRTIKIKLITPCGFAMALPKLVAGENNAVNGVWFDKDDNPISTGNIHVGLPAVRFEGTYQPQVPWPDPNTKPGWECRILGSPAGANRAAFPLDETFQATLQSAALISAYGLRPEYRSLDNPVVPNAQVNSDQLAAIRRETEFAVYRSTYGTPWYNPTQRAGDTVVVTDFELRQNAAKWLLHGQQVEMREPGDWYQTYDCRKGLAA